MSTVYRRAARITLPYRPSGARCSISSLVPTRSLHAAGNSNVKGVPEDLSEQRSISQARCGGRGTANKRSLVCGTGGLYRGRNEPSPARVDAVVIGAGQAGLAVSYHLQHAGGLRYVTLDANTQAGGAWRHRWPTLELFSTRRWSSLPGLPMFANGSCEHGYPSTGEMALYMEEYEAAMKLNVVRPVNVTAVTRTTMGTFLVETDIVPGASGSSPTRWECRAVISAAGTHAVPSWPRLPGAENFHGVQIHSNQYKSAEHFRGARVAVVGGGNSGAQIMAEIAKPGMAASALWSTLEPPSFLPKSLTGKEVFDSVARLRQSQGVVRAKDIPSLNSIIMQPSVLEAHEKGVYDYRVPAFSRLTPTGVAWDESREGGVHIPAGEAEVDVVIWCTGYHSNTAHLARLGIVREDSSIAMGEGDMGETASQPGVFAVGYGNWAGVGSGSIPGAAMYAKRAALAAVQHLQGAGATMIGRPARGTSISLWPSRPPPVLKSKKLAWPTSPRVEVNAAPMATDDDAKALDFNSEEAVAA